MIWVLIVLIIVYSSCQDSFPGYVVFFDSAGCHSSSQPHHIKKYEKENCQYYSDDQGTYHSKRFYCDNEGIFHREFWTSDYCDGEKYDHDYPLEQCFIDTEHEKAEQWTCSEPFFEKTDYLHIEAFDRDSDCFSKQLEEYYLLDHLEFGEVCFGWTGTQSAKISCDEHDVMFLEFPSDVNCQSSPDTVFFPLSYQCQEMIKFGYNFDDEVPEKQFFNVLPTGGCKPAEDSLYCETNGEKFMAIDRENVCNGNGFCKGITGKGACVCEPEFFPPDCTEIPPQKEEGFASSPAIVAAVVSLVIGPWVGLCVLVVVSSIGWFLFSCGKTQVIEDDSDQELDDSDEEEETIRKAQESAAPIPPTVTDGTKCTTHDQIAALWKCQHKGCSRYLCTIDAMHTPVTRYGGRKTYCKDHFYVYTMKDTAMRGRKVSSGRASHENLKLLENMEEKTVAALQEVHLDET